jgi:hypothetical protein
MTLVLAIAPRSLPQIQENQIQAPEHQQGFAFLWPLSAVAALGRCLFGPARSIFATEFLFSQQRI